MIITIVSVTLKTESGDDYLFTYDSVDGPEEFVQLVEKDLGDELAYVYEFKLNVLYGEVETYEFEDALRLRISEMADEE